MLFAIFPAAFFIGRAGAFLVAAVALVALLVPHWPSVDTTMLIGSSAQAMTLVVLGLVAASLFRLVSDAEEEHRKVAVQLEGVNRSLVDTLSLQDSEAQQKVALNEMSDLIQSCANSDEAFSILAGYGSRLFPEHGGAFFVYRNSRDYLELAASWGDLPVERLRTFTRDFRFGPVAATRVADRRLRFNGFRAAFARDSSFRPRCRRRSVGQSGECASQAPLSRHRSASASRQLHVLTAPGPLHVTRPAPAEPGASPASRRRAAG